jgi:hypothetical protein
MPMPFLVIRSSSNEIVATIDRDDLFSWLGLVELPSELAFEYRTIPIPAMVTLPKARGSQRSTALVDRETPLPATGVN